jgi:hypothetical protein
MPLYKNVASQKIPVFAWDTANDAPKTGNAAAITAQISKDGGACAATNDTNPTELDATDAPGIYIFDMLQAETNADMIVLFAKSSTADITLEPVIIYTTVTPIAANVTQWNGTAVASPSTAGIPEVNVKNIANAAVNTSSAQLGVNVVNWKGSGAQAMTGDAFARLGAPVGASISADITTVDTVTDNTYAIVNSGTYGNSALKTLIGTLNNLSSADVEAAVLADREAANTELATIPTTTAGWGAMIQFLFEYFRNVRTETAGVESLKKEDGTTELGSRTLADDGTTFTRGEMG